MPDVPHIDTTIPHSARVTNYWLGGKDYYPVDREMGDQVLDAFPELAACARAGRQLLIRAVTHMAAKEGIRQFLDVGTGLPTQNNVHEVAQGVAPDARVVYVDNDPLVLAHARALLTSSPEGETHYVDADLSDVSAVLERTRAHLDLSRPVGLTMMGTLGHFDGAEARRIVRGYVDALPSGSLLALGDNTDTSETVVEAARRWNATANVPYHLRSPQEIEDLFEGTELLEPGVVSFPLWRPEDSEVGAPTEIDAYCGVARKP
ncbi:SAM-dependent methyltransferase [Nocardiopsis sp. LOL_012]|uniref:SAM-dependent methyltransferase n=1 Tax=Nocardiopsis sp. LOL_012 TaxID=3345409 RepID=UPI003A880D75